MWQSMSETKYRVNEIFRSVQAEGANTGTPCVFVRFAGCNLKCPFCDTDHDPYVEMTRVQIDQEIDKLSDRDKDLLVVFTGGEPCLQLKESDVVGGMHPKAVETNGTLPVPKWINWTTISPKSKLPPESFRCANEIKVLMGMFDEDWMASLEALHPALYIQPLEKAGKMNIKDCLDFLKRHPRWKLSVQWHKLTGVR